MLNNMFSIFDDKNYMLSISFFGILIMSFILMKNFYKQSMMKMMFMYLMNFFHNYISSINIMKTFFLLVFIINLISLNFFSFSLTSHITFNMPLIMLLWFPILMMNFFKKKNSFFTHLLPLSTPSLLIPIMVIIEFISFFMRPMTLLLRLSINMIAGHVLISLISDSMLNKNFIILFPVIFSYMLLKFMVSFIQAYIIITLISLYTEEV